MGHFLTLMNPLYINIQVQCKHAIDYMIDNHLAASCFDQITIYMSRNLFHFSRYISWISFSCMVYSYTLQHKTHEVEKNLIIFLIRDNKWQPICLVHFIFSASLKSIWKLFGQYRMRIGNLFCYLTIINLFTF